MISLLLLFLPCLSQHVFRRFFYFEDQFVAYNTIDLEIAYEKTLPYTLNGKPGLVHFSIIREPFDKGPCLRTLGPATAYFESTDRSSCVKLLSSIPKENIYKLLDEKNPLSGFSISMKPYNVSFLLTCKKDQKSPAYSVDQSNNIVAQSKNACGTEFSFFKGMAELKPVTALLTIVLGVLLVVFGGSRWDLLFICTIFMASFIFLYSIFWYLFGIQEKLLLAILIVNFCLLFSILPGYVAYKLKEFNVPITGFFAGYLFLLLIVKLLGLSALNFFIEVLLFGFAAFSAWIFANYKEKAGAFLTSYVGCFLILYAMAYWVGLLPGLLEMLLKIDDGEGALAWFLAVLGISSVGGLFRAVKFDDETLSNNSILMKSLLK